MVKTLDRTIKQQPQLGCFASFAAAKSAGAEIIPKRMAWQWHAGIRRWNRNLPLPMQTTRLAEISIRASTAVSTMRWKDWSKKNLSITIQKIRRINQRASQINPQRFWWKKMLVSLLSTRPNINVQKKSWIIFGVNLHQSCDSATISFPIGPEHLSVELYVVDMYVPLLLSLDYMDWIEVIYKPRRMYFGTRSDGTDNTIVSPMGSIFFRWGTTGFHALRLQNPSVYIDAPFLENLLHVTERRPSWRR